ncbi:MAG TPA: glycosyltransferase family 4 protein [Jatrophihabitans sp.]|nr:glycosyltransferase family 4 protein [Jatrophihabitans sp.]
MRIAHVSDGYLPRMGGIERQVQGLTHAQLTAGHDVEIVTSVSPDDRATRVPVRGPERSGGRPGAIRYLTTFSGRDTVLAGGYDLVHVHASCASPLAWLTAASSIRAGLPTVVTTHSFWSWANPIFRGFDVALDWRSWPVTWTSVSQVAADSVAQVARPSADRPILLIPNGVDPELWRPDRLPRQRDRVVLVSVMRLATRKRPLHLLKMLRAVRERTPAGMALEVRIIGDGPKRAAMEAYLRRHRMADWVQLTGQLSQPEIRRVFDDADVYLSPAVLETFGIAALEARCAGLPVVAFGQTGVSDFIDDERNGLLVDTDAGFVDAVTRLACSAADRERLTAHNLATESGFTWPNVLRACDRAYAEAFDRVGRASGVPGPAWLPVPGR